MLNAGFAVAMVTRTWVDALSIGGWIGAPICHFPAYNGVRDNAVPVHECRSYYSRFERLNSSDDNKSGIGMRATVYDGAAYLNATATKDGEPVPILFVTAPVDT